MAIPNELASEFVKLVAGNDAKETERTVYGTVVLNGEGKYVRLDGSEILTPVSSTTNVENGERVTVMIKDHQAVITGNITSPAARTQEVKAVNEKFDGYATTEELDAKIEHTAENITSELEKTVLKEYSTTEQMNSIIDQRAEAITSSVAGIYATKDDVGNINERMSAAESKITPEEIVNTVTSSVIYQADIADAIDSSGQQMILSFAQSNAIEKERQTITISVQVWKNGVNITDQFPKQAFSWQRESGNDADDAEWNAQPEHIGVLSVTLERDEISKSCQIVCTLSESESLGYFTIEDGELILNVPDGYSDNQFELQNGILYGEDYYVLEDGCVKRNLASNTMRVTTNVFDHSVLETSHISIKDDTVDIGTGGNIHIAAGGTLEVESGNFNVDENGDVTMKGTVTAEAGKIGGWDIAPGSLSSGEGTKHIRISTEDATYGIWAGADDAANAPFRVGRDGSVYLTKLYVTDENGNAQANPVNLRTSYWKMDKAYSRAVQSMTVANGVLTITLYDGTSINFNKATADVGNVEIAYMGTPGYVSVTVYNTNGGVIFSGTIADGGLFNIGLSSATPTVTHVYENRAYTITVQNRYNGGAVGDPVVVTTKDEAYNGGWNGCRNAMTGVSCLVGASPVVGELYYKTSSGYTSAGTGFYRGGTTTTLYNKPAAR